MGRRARSFIDSMGIDAKDAYSTILKKCIRKQVQTHAMASVTQP